MQVHVLQHVSFEGLGSIAPWLESRGAEVAYTRLYESPQLPDGNIADMIVVMGGSMSANDENRFPWLLPEKRFIRDAIVRGIPVLGICLGAQLIASAMGASVSQNPVKEIGWFPVRAVPAPADAFHFPEECLAFHWHGETFDLPEGAVRLAKSVACENQAFQLNRNVIGIQFHLETTFENALALLDNCRDELIPGPFIQNEEALRAAQIGCYRAINDVMGEVLSYLLK